MNQKEKQIKIMYTIFLLIAVIASAFYLGTLWAHLATEIDIEPRDSGSKDWISFDVDLGYKTSTFSIFLGDKRP